MDIARVSSQGQITIPAEIRKKLKLDEGDKVLFVEEEGQIYLLNASLEAMKEFQNSMEGKAAEAGMTAEEDVTEAVEKAREEIWEENYADNG
ncbi:AbrB/MazE/SpoVT family DNA-binding domain-containing protein [Halarsenatibacter silvermanii]|uniref:Looped-hinge helix DNA binding domain-containing protein, AbrB family n=1 Tax=Halarsenatibacter silvermanii TaxID=321763 RepID=A0A1G9RWL2_9FIRM|nr:AbrB/MazE/SpoVT family DNA-binding domain-containing protein [Halarsenatibacter silvermanii]SDM27410.1 looped-hinge helix DNA binding domain-containing protein, AbrB family [Halarsenatibacter silvermanii]